MIDADHLHERGLPSLRDLRPDTRLPRETLAGATRAAGARGAEAEGADRATSAADLDGGRVLLAAAEAFRATEDIGLGERGCLAERLA